MFFFFAISSTLWEAENPTYQPAVEKIVPCNYLFGPVKVGVTLSHTIALLAAKIKKRKREPTDQMHLSSLSLRLGRMVYRAFRERGVTKEWIRL